MNLRFGAKIGSGAFATVYEAEDDIGRRLAVKIISPSMRCHGDALQHAKALARAEHPNVVRIIAVIQVQDPAGTEMVDAIVMERIDGETLADYLTHTTLKTDQVRTFGAQLIAGLQYIHSQGLAHGDLHGGNVMVCASGIKVLDILYSNSLAMLTTTSRDDRLQQDCMSIRFLLSNLMRHSELDPDESTAFQNRLKSPLTLVDIQNAFSESLSDVDAHGETRALEFCWQRFVDDAFVEGPIYANAMLDETPVPIRVSLFKRIIEKDAARDVHAEYILALWGALTEVQRRVIVVELQKKIETTVPSGNWAPHIRTIDILRDSAWQMLSRVARLKIENAIANDILSGYKDVHAFTGTLRSGILGTWALDLGVLFENRDKLIDNIASMLRMNWYTQNYIGEHLFPLLTRICDTDARRRKIVEAIVVALTNDARLVVAKLSTLPKVWQQEIADARK